MNRHADKSLENKSQAAGNSLPKLHNNGQSAFQLIDNRPEAIAQRKLQENINNSQQVQESKAYQKMANNSPQVKQLVAYQAMADNFTSKSNIRQFKKTGRVTKEPHTNNHISDSPLPIQMLRGVCDAGLSIKDQNNNYELTDDAIIYKEKFFHNWDFEFEINERNEVIAESITAKGKIFRQKFFINSSGIVMFLKDSDRDKFPDESIVEVKPLDINFVEIVGLHTRKIPESMKGQTGPVIPGATNHERPPADMRGLGIDNPKTRAMDSAEQLNLEMQPHDNFERNLEILKKNPNALFFVWGKSAMGQGDTAFVVRTVSLLKSCGLNAVGVKDANGIHDVSTSFNSESAFITPAVMQEMSQPGDVIIEGPLNDVVTTKSQNTNHTLLEANAGKFRNMGKGLFNLRLYEYGSIEIKGTQKTTSPMAPSVVDDVSNTKHAFMGMGRGEIGAFYNANELKANIPLEEALQTFGKENKASQKILALLKDKPKSEIFIGYSNDSKVAISWANAVSQAVGGGAAIIIAVFGGLHFNDAVFKLDEGKSRDLFFEEKKDGKFPEDKHTGSLTPSNATIITNNLPSQVMNALQRAAQPFTLATGNFSLSEAVENESLPSYETLPFNVGVASALCWQLEKALISMEISTKQGLGKAILDIAKTSPDKLSDHIDAIKIVLDNKEQVKLVMQKLRKNTDIKNTLIARLAKQMSL